MTRRVALAALLALALPAPADARTPDDDAARASHFRNPGARDCGWVSYRRGTDWGAQVRARGTPCRQARRLAWDFRDRRYGVIRRYRCVTRERPRGDRASAQVHADSRCVRRGSRGRVVVTLTHY